MYTCFTHVKRFMTRLTVGILVRPHLFEILPNSGLRFHTYSPSLHDVPLLVGHPSVEDHLAYFIFLSNSATPNTLLLVHALVSTSKCVLARDSGSELLGHSKHILTFTRYCPFFFFNPKVAVSLFTPTHKG